MTAIIDPKTKELVIRLPLGTPHPSSTGKTLVVATSSGFMATDATVNGKPVKVSISAIIPK